MEIAIVTYDKLIISYLKELATILVSKNYFSYIENAEDYVAKITHQIENDLPFLKKNKTPANLEQLGRFYCKIKGSQRTTWYVFFNQNENRYFIKHIANNHIETSGFLNSL